MQKKILSFYTKHQCSLCEKAKNIMEELSNEFSIELKEIDIYKDDQLLEKYQIMIPVIELDQQILGYGIIVKDELKKQLLEKLGNY